jgi:hypothetical protein
MKKFSPKKIHPADIVVSQMPELTHYDKEGDFDPERSEVLQWIAAQLDCSSHDAMRAFGRANAIGAISYSRSKNKWHGTRKAFINIAELAQLRGGV